MMIPTQLQMLLVIIYNYILFLDYFFDATCYNRVRTGFGKFWKVMEIDNAIFHDLESFGKGIFFKMAMEQFWIVVWENSKIS